MVSFGMFYDVCKGKSRLTYGTASPEGGGVLPRARRVLAVSPVLHTGLPPPKGEAYYLVRGGFSL